MNKIRDGRNEDVEGNKEIMMVGLEEDDDGWGEGIMKWRN